MIYICMLALLLLSGCSHVDFNRIDYQDFDCHSIDDHNLDSPEHQPIAVACGFTWHFDAPWGHKFEGEK